MSQSIIDSIIDKIPALRASVDEDARKKRESVVSERSVLIASIIQAEQSAAELEPKIAAAADALATAQKAVEEARRMSSVASRERSSFLAVASANRKRLHNEFGNEAVSMALSRVRSRLALAESSVSSLKTAIRELQAENGGFRFVELAAKRESLDDLEREIPELEAAEVSLQKLILSERHPDDIRAEVARITETIFGIATKPDSDDQADI